MSDDRTIRVFVSSTFRDMGEERDGLMTHVWPALRHLCRSLRVEFVDVDLRWGIPEARSTRRETLALCLAEVQRCRPFFIGLLGERYGWVPPRESYTTDLAEEEPWLAGAGGKSITELEILQGALNREQPTAGAFFYFRDPEFARRRGGEFLPGSPGEAVSQRALKQKIRDAAADGRVTLHEFYRDPAELVELIVTQLEAAILKRFPRESVPAGVAASRRAHEAFARFQRHAYVEPPGCFAALDTHCAEAEIPLMVEGEVGSGKTALLANWADHWQAAHSDRALFQCYVGAIESSTTHWNVLWNLIRQIREWCGDEAEVPSDHEQVVLQFPDWLEKARRHATRTHTKVVFIIDGLDHLAEQGNSLDLHWLPAGLFRGPLRLFLSSRSRSLHRSLQTGPCATLPLSPMEHGERRRFVIEYLRHFGKALEERQVEKFASSEPCASPLFLRTLLDDLRVTGVHDRLDERLDEYLAAADAPELMANVLTRYRRDYEEGRPGLVGDVLGLIMAARDGLTEPELLTLLRAEGQPQLPTAIWAPLRAALDDKVLTYDGVLRPVSRPMATAITRVFELDVAALRGYREQLITHFKGRIPAYPPYEQMADRNGAIVVLEFSPRGLRELPWLLARQGSWQDLYDLLRLPDVFHILDIEDRLELGDYWMQLEAASGLRATEAYEDIGRDPSRLQPEAAASIAAFLMARGHTAMALQLLRNWVDRVGSVHGEAYVRRARVDLAVLLRAAGRNQEAESALGTAIAQARARDDRPLLQHALAQLGHLHIDRGEFERAAGVLEEAVRLCGETGSHESADIQSSLASVYVGRGQNDRALALHRSAESVFRTLGDSSRVALSLTNQAAILGGLGQVRQALDLFTTAEEMCRSSGDMRGLSRALGRHGYLLISQGAVDEGLAMQAEKSAISEMIGDRAGLAEALGSQAAAYVEMEKPEEALRLLDREEAACRELGDQDGLRASLGNRGLALLMLGRSQLALAAARECQRLCSETGNQPGLRRALILEANILFADHRYPEALALLETTEADCQRLDISDALVDARQLQAATLLECGQLQAALERLDAAIRANEPRGDLRRLMRVTSLMTTRCTEHEHADLEFGKGLEAILRGVLVIFSKLQLEDPIVDCHRAIIRSYENILRRGRGDDPGEVRERLAVAHARFAVHCRETGDLGEAISHFEQRCRLREQVCAQHPDDLRRKYQYAVSHETLADALFEAGQTDRAIAALETGAGLLGQLAGRTDDEENVAVATMNAYGKLVALYERAGRMKDMEGAQEMHGRLMAKHMSRRLFRR